jgi:hypothetical protein
VWHTPLLPDVPPPPNVDASLAGLTTVPVDLSATGNAAGSLPAPTVDGTTSGMTPRANQARPASPAGFDPSFGKGTAEIAGDITHGTVDGLTDLAADSARIDLLHVPTGLARLLGSAWQGGGGVSGLGAIFWEPGRAQVALAVDEAIDGDFRASAASTVKAVGVGVTTGIALGELGATAVDAVRSVPGEPTGAAGGSRASKPFTVAGKRDVIEANRVANNGVTRCVSCGVETVPAAKSQSGISPLPSETQVDHIIARAKGGDGSPPNGQLLCRTCNRNKSDK